MGGKYLRDPQCLLFTVEERVARITLNRPDKRNTLSPALLTELRGGRLAGEHLLHRPRGLIRRQVQAEGERPQNLGPRASVHEGDRRGGALAVRRWRRTDGPAGAS